MTEQRVTDIMLDLETLGVSPGSVVLSMGAVAYDPRAPWDSDTGQELARTYRFMRKISLEDCCAQGLVIEPGSIRFWMSQSDEAREEAFSGKMLLKNALLDFSDWFGRLPSDGPVKVWAHGAPFDPALLKAAYKAVGLEEPWEFRELRDTRTVFDLAGITYKGTRHHVIEDCLDQCRKVCEGFAALGLCRIAA